MPVTVLVTGVAGVAGQVVCRDLVAAGYAVRMADVVLPTREDRDVGNVVRCDTRTPDDVRRAVEGVDAVVHLAAWHSGHRPPVSDATIFAVNVDGTFNVLEACREFGVGALVFASSMAYGSPENRPWRPSAHPSRRARVLTFTSCLSQDRVPSPRVPRQAPVAPVGAPWHPAASGHTGYAPGAHAHGRGDS